jgi:hypothetical protein
MSNHRTAKLGALGAAAAFLLSGCAMFSAPEGPPRAETLLALTAGHELIRVNTGQPSRVLERKPLVGLPAGEAIVGIDFRVARGELYALTRSGRLFRIDTTTGRLSPVGTGAPAAMALVGQHFGFDFNPVADRIRVVSDARQNLRLHPDTGASVDGDPARDGVQGDPDLAYVDGDPQRGQLPQVSAAAYTYNKRDSKLTTNFAIDRALGNLVLQGSREGVSPAVSPNSGRLTTVGSLGLGPLDEVSFDIADVSNAAFAAVRSAGIPRTRLVLVDMATGSAQTIGTVAAGEALLGIAIEP